MDIRRSPRRLVHGLGTSLAAHETDGLALEATRHGWPEADGAALAARTQLEATISAWTGSGTSTGSWMIRPAAWLARVRSRRPDRPLDPPLSAARDAFPQGIPDPGATPGGRRPRCENTPASEPAPGPRTGGSLPSTSVLPSAAQAAGWRRPQLQAPARDSRIRRLRIFTGALCASTPNVSCTLQYGTRRGLLIGSVPPRAEPSARCRCVASAPALPACAPASSARRCASSRPASLRTPSGPGHPP